MDRSEVQWDGTTSLGQVVSDKSFEWDWEAKNGTNISRRYCALPLVIRVAFTPRQGHRKGFEEIQRFTLKTPQIRKREGEVEEYESETLYHLHVVVKLDPTNPVPNPAEVRTYHIDGKMIKPTLVSKTKHRVDFDKKIRADSEWSVGDPSFKFILFYMKWTPLRDEHVTLSYDSLAEYRPPSPLDPARLPAPVRPKESIKPSKGDSDDQDTSEEKHRDKEKSRQGDRD
ncbi:hypothetical protein NPX13_g116 [Xylaria arbuscula]|uniref:Uncharacterized protein n=1 Tax=Xylaria arbuscula TaxID=114810 RepID=A0A9W8TQU4_9PEZI|nr:hypothetical protein NPX13_g116 [Xylaria arbuscula]